MTFSFQRASLTIGNVVAASTNSRKPSRPQLFSMKVNSRDQSDSMRGRVEMSLSPAVMRRYTSSSAANTAPPASSEKTPTLMSVRFALYAERASGPITSPGTWVIAGPPTFEETKYAPARSRSTSHPVSIAA